MLGKSSENHSSSVLVPPCFHFNNDSNGAFEVGKAPKQPTKTVAGSSGWRKAGQRLNSVDRTLQYLGPVNSKRIEPWTEASAVEQAVTLMAGNEDDEASKQTAIPCHLSDVRFQTCALDLLSASIGITTYHHDLGQEQTLLKLDPLMSLLQLLLFSYSFS